MNKFKEKPITHDDIERWKIWAYHLIHELDDATSDLHYKSLTYDRRNHPYLAEFPDEKSIQSAHELLNENPLAHWALHSLYIKMFAFWRQYGDDGTERQLQMKDLCRMEFDILKGHQGIWDSVSVAVFG